MVTLGKRCDVVLKALLAAGNAEEFDRLSYEAQQVTIQEVYAGEGPTAEQFKKEAAGAFAQLMIRYQGVVEKVNEGMKAREAGKPGALAQGLGKYPERTIPPGTKELMLVAGTHGGTMEWLLQQALVWKDDAGVEHRGVPTFEDYQKLGGAFDTSEAYTIRIANRADVPADKKYQVILHSSVPGIERPKRMFYLDPEKVKTLAAAFLALHKDLDALDKLNADGDQSAFEQYKKDSGVAYGWNEKKIRQAN